MARRPQDVTDAELEVLRVLWDEEEARTRIDERVTVVTRQLTDEHRVYLLFATPDRDASRNSNTLSAMVASLQIDEGRRH